MSDLWDMGRDEAGLLKWIYVDWRIEIFRILKTIV